MKEKLLIAFLVCISAVAALTTDMYLPALPALVEELHTTEAQGGFTLVAFFVAFGISTLVFGPLSDKYGRRPVLVVGFFMYFSGSLLCAVSGSVQTLMLSRILQGVGAGSGSVVSSAVVRDVFSGRRQEGILAVIQSMVMIGPVVAPFIGSFIIDYSGWRGIFVVQTVIGAALFVGSLIFRETIRSKNGIGALKSLARLGILMKDGRFAAIIILFALPALCIMAHVSTSTYIYQIHFGLTYYQYSLIYGVSSVGAIIGPAVYMALSSKLSRYVTVILSLAAIASLGIATFVTGESSPWIFAALMFALGMFSSVPRPAGAYLSLNFYNGDAGSASSLMGASASFLGSIGMAIVTIYPRYVISVGLISIAVGLIALAMWLAVSRRYDVG